MAWSASQYVKFEDERTRPARDLLAQVPLETIAAGIDLGCGPGNSTALLVERFGLAAISGLDSDADMLAAARNRLADTRFVAADLAGWEPVQPVDLLYSNAVFQWVPDHLAVLDRLMDALKPGGVLALQVPDNLNEPGERCAREVSLLEPFRASLAGFAPQRETIHAPSVYFSRLAPKAARVDVWHTIYNHPLADAAAIVEWVKGTGLRPYLDAVGAPQQDAFLAAYQGRIAAAYPPMPDGRVLFRFPRLFILAVKR